MMIKIGHGTLTMHKCIHVTAIQFATDTLTKLQPPRTSTIDSIPQRIVRSHDLVHIVIQPRQAAVETLVPCPIRLASSRESSHELAACCSPHSLCMQWFPLPQRSPTMTHPIVRGMETSVHENVYLLPLAHSTHKMYLGRARVVLRTKGALNNTTAVQDDSYDQSSHLNLSSTTRKRSSIPAISTTSTRCKYR